MRADSVKFLGAGKLLLLALGAARCDAAPAEGEPARWRSYDILVDLHDLPKSYSCDELWYKFRDVLLALGADSHIDIVPYRCQGEAGAPARCPRVEVQFKLPEALPSGEARWSDLRAIKRTTRLEPGQPHSLDDSDCALLQQLKDTLFAALPVRVGASRLACGAPPSGSPRFSVSVDTLSPAENSPLHASNRPD